MVTIDNGIYKIIHLRGDELLFVSDMLLPDKSIVWQEDEEPTLVSYKEFARYTPNGASFRYNEYLEIGKWQAAAVVVAGQPEPWN